jgi:hypothetical protein
MRKRRDVIGEGLVVNINELVAVLGNRREAVSPL